MAYRSNLNATSSETHPSYPDIGLEGVLRNNRSTLVRPRNSSMLPPGTVPYHRSNFSSESYDSQLMQSPQLSCPPNHSLAGYNHDSLVSPTSTINVNQVAGGVVTDRSGTPQQRGSAASTTIHSHQNNVQSSQEEMPLRIRHRYLRSEQPALGGTSANDVSSGSGEMSSYFHMSLEQITILQQSLERELLMSRRNVNELRDRIMDTKPAEPQVHQKQERRPSMGARAA
mmetsp:Transcript_12311/g.17977  ORF Transcript_12311/g.17977 Transcript_12311/m.17977 type:complete len:228 (-) Transcript_12311:94-777(-)|eukprot:CAMPEP_0194085146 /NCGR_PEP_ID=MMETSP0149-20130528/16419_1 /TAXON_ID=122233 /ORGANISM="Chaetoceros debilis, Strain MM31A-1" /LENGTH=227 /DNA_ID=CAMNT_0038767965 /DNA_START=51 /DNA_END=734 /DNA_ORIENTATION=+